MKVWCAECYGIMRTALLSKYDDFSFENTELLTNIKGNEMNQVVLYPLLKVRVPNKTKNGFSKSKSHVIMPFSLNYCPFCGKKISLRGEDFEE